MLILYILPCHAHFLCKSFLAIIRIAHKQYESPNCSIKLILNLFLLNLLK